MSHLTPQQFVDAIDTAASGDAAAHLASCAACRDEVAAMRRLVDEARAAESGDDPSPLFWPHFAERVHRAVAAEPAPRRAGWWAGGWRLGALAAGMAAVVMLAVVMTTRVDPVLPAASTRLAEGPDVPGPLPLPLDTEPLLPTGGPETAGPASPATAAADPEAWRRVVALTNDLPPEDLLGVASPGPASPLTIDDLSPDQLREFVRLLRAERGGM